ncbi:hypothetical protein P12x_002968 [Tundrisphaera lichenicola]|uniref:hypothetical protein n=1 Tax=Tundrisphaera lichenicola TaxID=2029860 RepID=UPI003EBB7ABC
MAVYQWLERHAQVIARHVDSRVKRELVAEYLETLQKSGKLTDEEQSRLTIALLKSTNS